MTEHPKRRKSDHELIDFVYRRPRCCGRGVVDCRSCCSAGRHAAVAHARQPM